MWEAETNADKCEVLQKTFFLEQPASDTHEDPAEYPMPRFSFTPITDTHIRRSIAKLAPFKAPGADGIMNVVFTRCADLLVSHLGPIYRATFALKVYPRQWKNSVTVVLRKPGKPDYTVPGAHRPIALLNTMAKVLSACVAENLVYMAETHNLLPENHFGCRPGRTTTDSLHYVTKYVKDAWRKSEVVSALFLDVKSAFPSVVLGRLLHDMRRRGVPVEYTEWIRRKVEGRTTTLTFDGYTSEPINLT